MTVKTVIIVSRGLVSNVFSTYPKNVHEIELLDLDNAEAESPEAKAEMEARIEEVTNAAEYNHVF